MNDLNLNPDFAMNYYYFLLWGSDKLDFSGLKCVFQENCRKLIVAMTKYLKIVIEKIPRSKFDLFQKFCHSDNNLLIYNDVSIQVIL